MGIPLNIDWQQILLHLFNFSILVGGLYLLLFKPVRSFMDKRTAHYAQMDEAAKAKEQQAQELEGSIRQREEKLEEEFAEKRQAAAKEAEVLAAQYRRDAQVQADKIISAAKASAEQERRQMLTEANREIVALAEEAMSKLMVRVSPYDEFLTSAEEDGYDENA